MKLTAKIFIFGGIGILVLAGILGVVFQKLFAPPPPPQQNPKGPKDTPVVVVGGSIRPTVAHTDTYGWTPGTRYTSYSAAAHATTTGGDVGTDLLTFANFDQYPDPLSGTGGWAITYADHNADNTRHPNAVKVCSDSSCSASATTTSGAPNPSVCQNSATFTGQGPIYAFADDRARWEEVNPNRKEITELHFHDTDAKCDGPSSTSEGACDKIYDVQVETCSQGSLSLTCNNAKGKCHVTIGQ
jgi:hypothetical protein